VSDSTARRYLRLGLRLGRHVEGIVDAYFGPPELVAALDAEPLADPQALVGDAERLLGELDDGWLRDQVVGLRTYAGVLAGESRSYSDEVEGCFGVRPAHTEESVFAAAHRRLDEVLPGNGALAQRLRRFEDAIRIPADRVERTAAAVIEGARAATRGLVELPDGEGVALEIVGGEPWLAFCLYLGRLRSHISVNVDLPISAIELLVLVMHETYPGHHAERCVKEHQLVRGKGRVEETIVLVPTPQSLVSEGIATLAPFVLLESKRGPALAALTQETGIELDLERALAIEYAREPLRFAELNAALMLHEEGATVGETIAYLEGWALMSEDLAAHMIRFFNEPTSRTYAITYPAGRRLCRAYVAGDPNRFHRLLTEQVRVQDLLEALDTGGASTG
jgi:hypothetical protein